MSEWLVIYAVGVLVSALIAGALSARYPRWDMSLSGLAAAFWPLLLVYLVLGTAVALLISPVVAMFGVGKALTQRIWGIRVDG